MGSIKKSAKKVITIDPEDIPEGTCKIYKSDRFKEKFSVCKEDGKIKIFPIVEG